MRGAMELTALAIETDLGGTTHLKFSTQSTDRRGQSRPALAPVKPSSERRAAPPHRCATGIFFFACLKLRDSQGLRQVTAVDDTLKRLLDAEVRAEKIAQQAEVEQEQVIQGALNEARAEEERFTAQIPDLHRSDIAKAQERADQTVAELKRRYDERHVLLRNMAEERDEEALAAAFQVLISPEL